MSAEIEVLEYHLSNGKPLRFAIGNEPRRKSSKVTRRQRRPTLASALKQAGKAGAAVTGCTVNPDGSVSLAFGKSPQNEDSISDTALNDWIAKHAN
jgi:hypothetical protein